LESSGTIWSHLESSGVTKETPRSHPGDTQRHHVLQISFWRSGIQKMMPLVARITFFI
jgi:hypothetical protein